MAKTLKIYSVDGIKDEVIDRTLTSTTIEPTQEEQIITAPEGYNGFNEVKVKGARLQQKIVTPSKETQVIKADEGYYGLSDVIVGVNIDEIQEIKEMLTDGANATAEDIKLGKTAYVGGKLITGNFEIGGTLDISENGEYDVVNYEKVNVEIHPSGTLDITENGTYDISDYASVNVQTESTLKKLLDAIKSCKSLFANSNLTDVSDLISYNDTENVTNMSSMFKSSRIYSNPLLNTSNVTNMSAMFYSALNLRTLHQMDTSNVTDMSNMFYDCGLLPDVVEMDTSNVTNMSNMFQKCIKLETVTKLDMRSVTNTSNMFWICYALTNLTLLNIKTKLQVGSGSSWGYLLTLESLIGLCQQCVNVNDSRTLTIGTANLEKLANVYVKLTNEPEEDETLPKIPMVQCESTDEGAMLISEYMKLKNWTLA